MGRPLRVDEPGTTHHLYNVGRSRQLTFLTRRDYEMFLLLIRKYFEQFDIELLAYCLMGNHYHLVARSNGGNISVAMQRIIGQYTRYFNDTHDLNGALFCGRFRSATVTSHRQLILLIRYVHRNPQDISWVTDLGDYEWSSLGCYLDRRRRPTWLHLVSHPGLRKPSLASPRRRRSRRPTRLPRQGQSPLHPRNFEALFRRALDGPEPPNPAQLEATVALRGLTAIRST